MLAVLLGGCATGGIQNTDALQQAMDANHKAAVSVLKRANEEDLPYRIEDGLTRSAFSADDLSLLAPADIDSWDKILGALDSYCGALSCLTSPKASGDFSTACEGLGSKVGALAKAGGIKTGTKVSAAETAVTELGSLLMRYKGDSDARLVAEKADPSFQKVVGSLIEAFGFEGSPPAPSPHGILATYELDFSVGTAMEAKKFKGGEIEGFAAMGDDQKRASIRALLSWLKVKQDHDEFVASVRTLVTALDKARLAHAALASRDAANASAAFAQLQAEMKNVQAIYQQFTKG